MQSGVLRMQMSDAVMERGGQWGRGAAARSIVVLAPAAEWFICTRYCSRVLQSRNRVALRSANMWSTCPPLGGMVAIRGHQPGGGAATALLSQRRIARPSIWL